MVYEKTTGLANTGDSTDLRNMYSHEVQQPICDHRNNLVRIVVQFAHGGRNTCLLAYQAAAIVVLWSKQVF